MSASLFRARGDGRPPIRAVLYDFDGTLADTTELIMTCYRHTMRRHLGVAPPDAEWLAGFGLLLETQIDRFARSAEECAAMLATYKAFQREKYEEMVHPFPGAVETVAELAARRVPLAIVTSRHRESTLRGVDLCGLVEHFPVIVTPEDVTHAKPHPEPVLRALAELGVSASEALFIGDSPHDLVAGRAAGTRTAAALWGPFRRSRLEEEAPDALLHDHREVLDLLG